MFEDSRGGLWLGGCEAGADGLVYFDGSRFFSPVANFPKATVSGMAEDSEGGIWMASEFGLHRIYEGQLQKIFDGAATAGITRIASDVFVAAIASPGANPSTDSALVRLTRISGKWQTETILRDVMQVRFTLDRSGQILYGCEGGFCELQSRDVIDWHPGAMLPITRHRVPTRTTYTTNRAVVWKDRLGCVWLRGQFDASYQCPDDRLPVTLPPGIASLGGPMLLEADDGSMVIPSFAKISIGRPGNFRVLTAANGYPRQKRFCCRWRYDYGSGAGSRPLATPRRVWRRHAFAGWPEWHIAGQQPWVAWRQLD